jgi:hypothetical protein
MDLKRAVSLGWMLLRIRRILIVAHFRTSCARAAAAFLTVCASQNATTQCSSSPTRDLHVKNRATLTTAKINVVRWMRISICGCPYIDILTAPFVVFAITESIIKQRILPKKPWLRWNRPWCCTRYHRNCVHAYAWKSKFSLVPSPDSALLCCQ